MFDHWVRKIPWRKEGNPVGEGTTRKGTDTPVQAVGPQVTHCHGSLRADWRRIPRHRAFQERVSLLRTNSRDDVGTASTEGQPPETRDS